MPKDRHKKMKIESAKWTFKFSLFSIFLYLIFLILLISLGFWQLTRADEKTKFLEKEQQSRTKYLIKLSSIIDDNSTDLRYRKVELSGQYDPKHQYLIDNQIVNGQVGYFVLTPFKLDEINKSVLVNRGWVPLNKGRSILPDLSIATLKNNLIGRINNFPVVGIKLAGADIPTKGWPSVVQVVDINMLSKKLGYALFPFQIELDADMNNGYTRVWKSRTVVPPEKHIAYAVQWFGLAITLTLLFIWFSRIK